MTPSDPGALPPALLESVRRSAGLKPADFGEARLVGGGCINNGVRLGTGADSFFLKWNPRVDERFFRVEAEGLAALAGTATVRTPAVVARSGRGEAVPWLLLEWIEPGRGREDSWARLGRELAALHRCGGIDSVRGPADGGGDGGGHGADPGRVAGRWGWHADNVIGSLPQPNGWAADWGDFWARRRIRPLARELLTRGDISSRQHGVIARAADRAAELLDPVAQTDGPSLLHGDLWSGNVLVARGGRPVLIDPAVYIGHREVDLAMCRLFGGFPQAFYDAYSDAWPLVPGHRRRLGLYQLYPLLVHARLFGGGYVGSALRAAESVGRRPE